MTREVGRDTSRLYEEFGNGLIRNSVVVSKNTLSTEYRRYGILFLRGEWKNGLHGPIGYPVLLAIQKL